VAERPVHENGPGVITMMQAQANAARRRVAGLVATLLSVGCLVVVAGAQAAPPADLDGYAERALETFGAPGMAVTIVERGRPSVVRTYGVQRLGEPTKVDEHTLFSIGSTTKAFTSALLAMLVDEKKLTWDTKVSDVLPGFKMYDPYASSEMTVLDLLVHRSGLGPGAGDLLFYPPTTFSRAEILHRLRYIKPATSFRSAYAYDNLLYIVAGLVVEAVEKASWEDVVRRRVFDPLQMKRTSPVSSIPNAVNRAWPHGRFSSEVRGTGPLTPLPGHLALDVAAPAGAINSSASEIARWLELLLGQGLDPRTGTRLYSEAVAREMWLPHTVVPIYAAPPLLATARPNFRAYALGWNTSDYRGRRIVSHGGGLPGFATMFVIVPDRDIAFAIFTNSEENGMLSSMQYRLLDHYLDLKSPDWIDAVSKTQAERIAKAQVQLAKVKEQSANEQGAAKGPSLPLAQYAGRYRDAWYGTATIESSADSLSMRFDHTPTMASKLEHVRFDTFRTRWTDRVIEDAYVTFALKSDGSVDRMAMRAVSPLADFSFDYQDLLFVPDPQ